MKRRLAIHDTTIHVETFTSPWISIVYHRREKMTISCRDFRHNDYIFLRTYDVDPFERSFLGHTVFPTRPAARESIRRSIHIKVKARQENVYDGFLWRRIFLKKLSRCAPAAKTRGDVIKKTMILTERSIKFPG